MLQSMSCSATGSLRASTTMKRCSPAPKAVKQCARAGTSLLGLLQQPAASLQDMQHFPTEQGASLDASGMVIRSTACLPFAGVSGVIPPSAEPSPICPGGLPSPGFVNGPRRARALSSERSRLIAPVLDRAFSSAVDRRCKRPAEVTQGPDSQRPCRNVNRSAGAEYVEATREHSATRQTAVGVPLNVSWEQPPGFIQQQAQAPCRVPEQQGSQSATQSITAASFPAMLSLPGHNASIWPSSAGSSDQQAGQCPVSGPIDRDPLDPAPASAAEGMSLPQLSPSKAQATQAHALLASFLQENSKSSSSLASASAALGQIPSGEGNKLRGRAGQHTKPGGAGSAQALAMGLLNTIQQLLGKQLQQLHQDGRNFVGGHLRQAETNVRASAPGFSAQTASPHPPSFPQACLLQEAESIVSADHYCCDCLAYTCSQRQIVGLDCHFFMLSLKDFVWRCCHVVESGGYATIPSGSGAWRVTSSHEPVVSLCKDPPKLDVNITHVDYHGQPCLELTHEICFFPKLCSSLSSDHRQPSHINLSSSCQERAARQCCSVLSASLIDQAPANYHMGAAV